MRKADKNQGILSRQVSPKTEMEAPVMEDSLPNEQVWKSSQPSHQDYMSQDEDEPRDTAWYRSAHKTRKKKDMGS